jgi:hypothetical protein
MPLEGVSRYRNVAAVAVTELTVIPSPFASATDVTTIGAVLNVPSWKVKTKVGLAAVIPLASMVMVPARSMPETAEHEADPPQPLEIVPASVVASDEYGSPLHRCGKRVRANQGEQLILRYRHIHLQAIARGSHAHLIERAGEVRI